MISVSGFMLSQGCHWEAGRYRKEHRERNISRLDTVGMIWPISRTNTPSAAKPAHRQQQRQQRQSTSGRARV